MTNAFALKRLVAAAAAAGALFLGSGAASLAAQPTADDLNRSMLDYSFLRAGAEFFKQVDDQVLLDGAVAGMRAVIKSKGGDPSKVPTLHNAGSKSADLSLLNQELVTVDRDFSKDVSEREIAYSAIAGIMRSLNDRWTVFMTPDEYKSLNQNLEGGGFPGVGIVIDTDPQTKSLLVTQVVEGGPAQKAGLQAGDIIVSIDGKTTAGLAVPDESKLLRGPAGTTVVVVIQRKGEAAPISMSIVRAFIHEPSVLTRTLDGNIAYLRVLVFGVTTGEELTKALDEFQRAGVKGYVLDLRYNGGGYLNAAVDVASKFVSEGPIVSIDGRQKPFTTINAEDTAVESHPLVVLVNGYTASASEIAAGAVQDNGAGVLIGSKTYGKGEVQTIYPLPDGSAIKITTARYLTPHGTDINTIGIKPDIEVLPDVPAQNIGNLSVDPQLQRAMAYINDQIAAGLAPGSSGAASGKPAGQ
jgi:carboxyl-terminal processing protease